MQPHRPIRSFVIRAGRMTASQKKALEIHWQHYGLAIENGMLDSAQTFHNSHPLILEIGFGMGASLLQMAFAHPHHNYVGIEVHPPGVATLLRGVHEQNLHNVRVYAEDAIEVLKQCISDNSVEGVQLFFPDPWPK